MAGDEGTDERSEVPLRVFCDDQNRPGEVRAIRVPDDQRRSPLLPDQLANGWLLFTLGLERRRLAPLPPGWHLATEAQLQRWWADADPILRKQQEGPEGPPGDVSGGRLLA